LIMPCARHTQVANAMNQKSLCHFGTRTGTEK